MSQHQNNDRKMRELFDDARSADASDAPGFRAVRDRRTTPRHRALPRWILIPTAAAAFTIAAAGLGLWMQEQRVYRRIATEGLNSPSSTPAWIAGNEGPVVPPPPPVVESVAERRLADERLKSLGYVDERSATETTTSPPPPNPQRPAPRPRTVAKPKTPPAPAAKTPAAVSGYVVEPIPEPEPDPMPQPQLEPASEPALPPEVHALEGAVRVAAEKISAEKLSAPREFEREARRAPRDQVTLAAGRERANTRTAEQFKNIQNVFSRAEIRQAPLVTGYVSETIHELPGGLNTESYATFRENEFRAVADAPLSTFSIDVDTASYSIVRRFLEQGQLPPVDAVRIEELINYFDYDDPAPTGVHPFSVTVEVAESPWEPRHRLARIGLRGEEITRAELGGSNLVFLLDVSGSMRSPNKLPLVQHAMRLLVEQLDNRDSVAIVTYAGRSAVSLRPTSGSDRATILAAIDALRPGGSTAGAAGIRDAYRIAREGFIEGGVNRVILATDGDFNVGVTHPSELLEIIEEDARRGIFLTALGFGMGNYKDDRLENLADRGNGNYAYVDNEREARKCLVEEIGGTLVTIAKDVKIQVEFNPAEVGAYRLIGYENRKLRDEEFNDDTKDAGEIGSGHSVTALYEIVPAGDQLVQPGVDPLRYQAERRTAKASQSGELLTVKLRYKRPESETSNLIVVPVRDEGHSLETASDDLRFSAAVAGFGMTLRRSPYASKELLTRVITLGIESSGSDDRGLRAEFLGLAARARGLMVNTEPLP